MKITRKLFNRDLNFKIIWPMVIPIIVLCIFGLVLLRSTSSQYGYSTFYKQLTWMTIGSTIFIFIQFIRLRIFNEYAYHLYVLLLISLLITYLMPVRGGAQRWIILGGFSIQPSEIGKLIVVFAIAKFLSDRKVDKNQLKTIILTLTIGLIPALLVLGQPDLGTSIIYIAMTFPMLYWIGIRPYYLFLFMAPIISMISSYSITSFYIWMFILVVVLFLSQPSIREASIVFIINICSGLLSIIAYENLQPHQKDRLLVLLDPYIAPLKEGFQVIQSMVSIGSGGILGKGFASGTQTQLKILPVRDTDFIVSVAGEEFGLFGIIYILLFFSIFIYWVTEYLRKINNDFSSLTLVGILAILFVHLIVNMGMTVGLFPVTGLPAPFLSYGGTFLLTCMIMIGIVNNNITNNI